MYSQEYSYRQYTIFDGLPQNQIMGCYQDTDGFLWVGTKHGVARFDGKKFHVFGNNVNVNKNVFRFFEYGGKLYHYGDGGIFVLKDNVFQQIFDKRVLYMAIDNMRKEVYVSTRDSFFKYCPKDIKIENIPINTNEFIVNVNNFGNKTVYASNKGTFYIRDSVYSLIDNVGGILETGNAGFYIVNYGLNNNFLYGAAIFRLHGDKMEKIYELSDGYISSNLHFSETSSSLYFVQNNSRWVKIDTNGRVLDTDSLSDIFINYVYEGNDGCVWLATEAGLYRLKSSAFVNYNQKSGMPKYVWSIFSGSDSSVVFATFLGKLFELKNGEIKEVEGYQKHIKKSEQIYMNAYSSLKGEWVIPTSHRLIVKDKNNYKFVEFHSEGKHVFILSCYADTVNGFSYFGTTDGVFVCDDNWNTVANIQTEGSNVLSIEQDVYGRFWFCTTSGVYLSDGKQIIDWEDGEIAVNQGVTSCKRDSRGNMWLAGRGSLMLHCYDTVYQVYNSSFFFVNEVVDKYIVAGSILGILVIDLERFYHREIYSMKFFDRFNGFMGIESGQNGTFVDKDESIWINTSESVVRFFPKRVKINSSPPKTIVYSIQVADPTLQWNEIVRFPQRQSLEYKIDWWQNNVKIDFVGIDFFSPERVTYRYRLLGLSDAWHFDSTGVVVYTNLRHGKYQFELASKNENGYWSDEVVKINFTIKSAFWETLWFNIAMYLLVIILSFIIFFVVKKYLKRKREREMTIKKQFAQHQLEMLNSQLDPHFIFNVISAIGTEVKMGNTDKAYNYFVRVSRVLRESLSYKSQMFRFLDEELKFVENYLELQKFRFGEKLDYKIIIDDSVNNLIIVPKMCVQIFVENSVKHGLENKLGKGQVEITVKEDVAGITIEIVDDGVGRKKSYVSENKGIGTEVMMQFVELTNKHNLSKAHIKIDDLEDENGFALGTKVMLFIPKDYVFSSKENDVEIKDLLT